MSFRFRHVLLIALFIALLSSCVSREKIVYFQDIEKLAQNSSLPQPEITFKANDLISIIVSAATPESVRPFNVYTEARTLESVAGTMVNTNLQQLAYLVDKDGFITFPELGKIEVGGMSTEGLKELLTDQLSIYIKNPIVNIRLLNFRVSVLGEVNRPGTYPVDGDKISITEALGLAGDLTIYGRRDNILLIREKGDTKNYVYLDIRSSNLMDSEYYYLKQNDVIYVEPNSAQRQAASFNRNSTVYISIASLLLSVIVLITK